MADPTHIDLGELIRLNGPAAALQLRTTSIRARQNGQYLSRIKGRGMEFDESRPYQPGDDVRNIDWRVTARTGKTYSKMFREERERPVLISVDMRAPMFFATQGRFKSCIAADLAALLAWTANRQGDRVGGEIYGDSPGEGSGDSPGQRPGFRPGATWHNEFRPRRGQHNVLHLLKTLSTVQWPAQPPTVPAHQSLQDAAQRLHRIAHPGSLVCVISDFRGLDDAVQTRLIDISRHSEVVLLHVYDPLEASLPDSGYYHIRYGDRVLAIDADDASLRSRYRRHFAERTDRLDRLSVVGRMTLLHCRTDDRPVQVLRAAFSFPQARTRRTA